MLRRLPSAGALALFALFTNGCGDSSGGQSDNSSTSQSSTPGTHNAPTCNQTCQDYLVSLGLVDTVWFTYNQNVAGQPVGNVDRTASCPLGGSVHITGTAASSDGITSVHLIFDLTNCANADSVYSLTFTGSVTMDGSFRSGADKYTAVTFSSETLRVAGDLDFLDDPTIQETTALSTKQESSPDSSSLTGQIDGRTFSSKTALEDLSGASDGSGGSSGSGRATGGATAVASGGPGCPSIYQGTYSGLFSYEYRIDGDPPTTSNASFSLTIELACVAVANGSAVLNVTHAQVTHPYFGCPIDCMPDVGSVATLPASPPTSPSDPSRPGQGIAILFPNGSVLGTVNDEGHLAVSDDGTELSNAYSEVNTWGAANATAVSAFPGESGRIMTGATSWTLSKNRR